MLWSVYKCFKEAINEFRTLIELKQRIINFHRRNMFCPTITSTLRTLWLHPTYGKEDQAYVFYKIDDWKIDNSDSNTKNIYKKTERDINEVVVISTDNTNDNDENKRTKNDIMNDGVTIENRFSKLVEKCSNSVESTTSSNLLSVVDEMFIHKIKISAEIDNSGISKKDIDIQTTINKNRLQFERVLHETNLKSIKIHSYNDIKDGTCTHKKVIIKQRKEKQIKSFMCLQMKDMNYHNVYHFNNSGINNKLSTILKYKNVIHSLLLTEYKQKVAMTNNDIKIR